MNFSILQRFQLLLISLFMGYYLNAQTELNYPNVTYNPQEINANWVTYPAAAINADHTILFRNTFDVNDLDKDFIINISADNHYFLYVNGELVTHGPQLGDIRHWKYETLNLKNNLTQGKNVVAVKVVNFGEKRFFGVQSIITSLMVNGVTENAKILNTQGRSDQWKCYWDKSYRASEVKWREKGENSIIGGFYANYPTDNIDMNKYPVDWNNIKYDDSDWQKNKFFESVTASGGSMAYILEPRNLPLLTWQAEPMGSIVRSKGLEKNTNFPSTNIIIPKNSKATFLLDVGSVTNGHPSLIFSKGKNANITIKYGENLFGPNKEKGDRNSIKNKKVIGYQDVIISSGNEKQEFLPNSMRAFRYVQFEIETKEQQLILEKYTNYISNTKIPSIASFTSDNETYNKIFEICKRTVDISTRDYFLSDVYYETMQYVGDTKVHALIWQAMSGNLDHTKNAIRQFLHSQDSEGNILGAYPLKSTFIFPTYSLIWVDMVADYYNLTQDKSFIKEYENGIISTLNGFERNMNEQNLAGETSYTYFVDWYTNKESVFGTSKKQGQNSAVVSLHYVHALQNASKLFKEIGNDYYAEKYADRALEIKNTVYSLCYDTSRNIFAEQPDKSIYDQHTNIMAILTNTIAPEKQEALLEKLLNEKDLIPATYYYRYYLFEAIKKTNSAHLFAKAQEPWNNMVFENMTTTLERFESAEKQTRSEAHPWSASPALFHLNFLAGITSKKNNFEEVKIAPAFGDLKFMKGIYPPTNGNISFHLVKKNNQLTAEIEIPTTMKGELVWNDKIIPLKSGLNEYKMK